MHLIWKCVTMPADREMALEAEAMDEVKATRMMMVSVGDPST
jgi:hypothetical protein